MGCLLRSTLAFHKAWGHVYLGSMQVVRSLHQSSVTAHVSQCRGKVAASSQVQCASSLCEMQMLCSWGRRCADACACTLTSTAPTPHVLQMICWSGANR